MGRSLYRGYLLFCSIWLSMIVLMAYITSVPMTNNQEYEQLNLKNEINNLKLENSKLKMKFGKTLTMKMSSKSTLIEPKLPYTMNDFLLRDHIKELKFFLQKKLKDQPHLSKDINNRFQDIVSMDKRAQDTNGFSEWRQKESDALHNMIKTRLHTLQHPKDCSTAKVVQCKLKDGCGFGCGVHHLLYCLIMAYALQRTLIIDDGKFRYSKDGLKEFLRPVTPCTVGDLPMSVGEIYMNTLNSDRAQSDIIANKQAVALPLIDGFGGELSKYLPYSVPRDLGERLMNIHGHPIVWWIGHILSYIMTPNEQFQKYLDDLKSQIQFKHPIVGVHVRRGDKIAQEAEFHALSEYMEKVDEYFKQLKHDGADINKMYVYIATDDPGVIKEAETKYPQYTYVLNSTNSRTTGHGGSQYTSIGFRGILTDILLLSQTDFLVCTFSSQVCRCAYEIMQTLHINAHDRFRSLDDSYYFGGSKGPIEAKVLYDHIPVDDKEVAMTANDIVNIAGNHWDGFSMVMSKGKRGLVPSYKIQKITKLVPFPTYTI
ncbi:unnamed protein product [Owenia fusiformis]|uniref:Uncharacterized protein n=1 Tax=Owenia fusiformis TaxID=6347 RepID=A0A8J1TT18_OWEFU|nr:unnamed protein product [Owenia fusiformis]